MTVCAAVRVRPNVVHLAADSCEDRGGEKDLCSDKIVVLGTLGIASAGSSSLIQAVLGAWPDTERRRGGYLDRWLRLHVTPVIKKAVSEFSKDLEGEDPDLEMLVTDGDHLCKVSVTGHVKVVELDYAAIGAGKEAALGALWTQAHIGAFELDAGDAVEAACAHCMGCELPVHVVVVAK